MLCPMCIQEYSPKYKEWKCKCGESNCVHIESCPTCLKIRISKPPIMTEPCIDPKFLKEQIIQYCTFQLVGVSFGLNLQMAEMMGMNRPEVSKHLFKTLEKNLRVSTQHILKNMFGVLPVNEIDRVFVNKTIKEYLESLRLISNNVKEPPPDSGVNYKP